jgi:hypothetical protein
VKLTFPAVLLAGLLTACSAHARVPVVPVHTLALSTHVSQRVIATCAEAAAATRIRVVCPPVVPADGVTGDHTLYGPQVTDPDVYTMSFNNGQVPGHIHWEVGAGSLEGIATAEFDESDWDAPSPKRPAVLIGGERCGGYLIAIYRFPLYDGQLEGHDVALATVGRVTYFASVHGYTHDDADVAMLLAILLSARGDHVTRVWPTPGACRAVVTK